MKQFKYNSLIRPSVVTLITLMIGLSITYQLFHAAQIKIDREKQAYFDFRVREASNLISQRMQAYEQILLGASGLLNASNSVERYEFEQYVAAVNLTKNYPGIQGVGFSQIIPSDKKAQHIASIRSEGFSEYTIRPEGQRDIYTSIIYLEPFLARNLRAFGYDMFSEPIRHAAMQKAIDSGQTTLSGKVKLVQETGKQEQAGFLMYVPIYRSGTNNETLAERREHILGWVYAPFRMNDLMRGLFGEHANDLSIQIFDEKNMSTETLMYDSENDNLAIADLAKTLQLQIEDHMWTIHIQGLPSINSRVDVDRAKQVATVGAVISVLLSLLIWFLATGRERAIKAAERMNSELIIERQRLSGIIEGTHVGTWAWNVQTGEIRINDLWANFIGYELSELEPTSIETWMKFTHPDDAKLSGALLENHFSGELDYYECEARMRHKDGHWIWVLDRGKVMSWTSDGKPLMMLGTHQEISERKRIEFALRDSEQKFRQLIQEAPLPLCFVNNNEEFEHINNRFSQLFGYSKDDVPTLKEWWQLAYPDESYRDWVLKTWTATVEDSKLHATDIEPIEYNVTCKDGTVRVMIISGITFSDGFLATFIDVTERKRLELELTSQAHLDYLTGLSNRRHFMEQGEVELSRAIRYDTPLSLLMLDIDFFKNVNDTYGHQVGDIVLQTLSKVCQGTMRQVDIGGRLGGEEFAVILPETEAKEAIEVAERLREAIAKTEVMIPIGLPIHFTVSIGVTTLNDKDVNIDVLLNQADKALYKAKETGRNKACVG